MQSYRQFQKDAGVFDIPRIEKTYNYFAYKEGKSVKCETFGEAKKISNNTEKVCNNTEEVEANSKLINQAESRALTAWKLDLRQEYSYLSDKMFDVCYSKAYEEGHAYGYDEIANEMISIVEFAEKIAAIVL